MTHSGKIARLPLAIRQQLNLRLQNGELAQHLLSWPNRLPKVQAILAAHFAAKPPSPSTNPTSPIGSRAVISTKKQQRIRQIMGLREEYGPAAAPESLLAAAT